MNYTNLRKAKPQLRHKDFECWIFQTQPKYAKFLDEDWEFAVVRQGFYNRDYNEKVFSLPFLDTRQHWMLIKPLTDEAREILLNIDYNKLARANGATRAGFGKADLVEHYKRVKAWRMKIKDA